MESQTLEVNMKNKVCYWDEVIGSQVERETTPEEDAEVDGFFGTHELPEVLAAIGASYRECNVSEETDRLFPAS